METFNLILLVCQVLIAITLIAFILLQHGKGADAGVAFGSGASSTVFGSRGSSNFLTRMTTVLAVLFLGNSLLLGYLATERVETSRSIMGSEIPLVEDLPETGLPPVDGVEDAGASSDVPSMAAPTPETTTDAASAPLEPDVSEESAPAESSSQP